jgi:predicted permease
MTTMLFDLRMASRSLRRAPGFTAIAAVSIALGMGANVTIFGIVNSFFLRALAVSSPDELVAVYARTEGQPWRSLSYPDVESFRADAGSLAGLTAFTMPGVRVSLRDETSGSRAMPAAFVTRDYFSVLGVRPVRGRFFDGAEHTLRGSNGVVIAERLWNEAFGADPSVIGREVWLNRQPFRVVGIAPAAFTGTFANLATAVWLPLERYNDMLGGPDSVLRRDSRFLNAIGRVRRGASREAVDAELSAIARGLEASYPETNEGFGVSVTDATGVPPFIRRLVGGFIAVLMMMVGLVLLVACANVAGLQLARSTARSRDVAIRASLGASRWRIVRPLLVEALMLALLGGVLGLGVAKVATIGLLALVPPIGLPLAMDLSMDTSVVLFTLCVSLVAAMAFGLLPALHATRTDLINPLKAGGPGSGSQGGRLRAILLVGQIALSVLLLVCTGLLVRGLRRAAGLELGFDPSRIALFATEPAMLGYDQARTVALVREQIRRAESQTGVQSATAGRFVLLGTRGDQVPVIVRNAAHADTLGISYNVVEAGWFRTLGIPLLRGRDFTERDDRSSDGVAIIGETMARRLWPDDDPLGQRFEVRGVTFTVVGIARDVKYGTPGEAPRAFVHFALAQEPLLRIPPGEVVLHVRAESPATVVDAVRRPLLSLDPDLPIEPSLMSESIAFSLFPARLASRIVGASGFIALVLSCVGLYGIAAFAVARRMREIGIRIALGARGGDVARLVLGQGARLALIGIALGVPAAFGASQLLRGMLFGVPPSDPLTYVAIAAILSTAVLLASALPALHATRIDPVVALRAE